MGATQPVQFGQVAFNVFNGCPPIEGPRCIPVTITLNNNSAEIDFFTQFQRKDITQIQSVFVDNSENTEIFQLTNQAVNQTIDVPAGSQGYYPILAPNPPKFLAATKGAATIQLQFLNFSIGLFNPGGSGGGMSGVTEVDTGLGLTGGPITSTGTISALKASAAQFGVVEVDGTTITAAAGVISAVEASGANPSATAGPVAIDGSASTFMRSDGAPAVQKCSAAQFGLCEVDGTTITAAAGVISAVNETVPVFNCYCSTNQTLGTSVTLIDIDTVTFDNESWFDLVNHRYTPQKAGYYLIGAAVIINSGSPPSVITYIFKNGASIGQQNQHTSSSVNASGGGMNTLVHMNGSTDYVDFRVNCTAAETLLGGALFTFMYGHYVGP
ncbi:MAG: DUF1859 domain-containing protein [Streptosporangiaceae bacterium]